MNFRSLLLIVVGGFICASSLATPSPDTDVFGTSDVDLMVKCGPHPLGHPVKGRRDYNQMSSNPKDARDLRYHEYYHIQPATKHMEAGKLNMDVMNNLHFVLHKVPNDHRALSLLLQWDKAGGQDPRYKPPVCYFIWAQEFAPTDDLVLKYGGLLFYSHGDIERASRWWGEALKLDPGSTEVHYNLGLVAFDQGRYEDARKHAQVAYSGGYPLAGLRDKLQSVGQWTSSSASQ